MLIDEAVELQNAFADLDRVILEKQDARQALKRAKDQLSTARDVLERTSELANALPTVSQRIYGALQSLVTVGSGLVPSVQTQEGLIRWAGYNRPILCFVRRLLEATRDGVLIEEVSFAFGGCVMGPVACQRCGTLFFPLFYSQTLLPCLILPFAG